MILSGLLWVLSLMFSASPNFVAVFAIIWPVMMTTKAFRKRPNSQPVLASISSVHALILVPCSATLIRVLHWSLALHSNSPYQTLVRQKTHHRENGVCLLNLGNG